MLLFRLFTSGAANDSLIPLAILSAHWEKQM